MSSWLYQFIPINNIFLRNVLSEFKFLRFRFLAILNLSNRLCISIICDNWRNLSSSNFIMLIIIESICLMSDLTYYTSWFLTLIFWLKSLRTFKKTRSRLWGWLNLRLFNKAWRSDRFGSNIWDNSIKVAHLIKRFPNIFNTIILIQILILILLVIHTLVNMTILDWTWLYIIWVI